MESAEKPEPWICGILRDVSTLYTIDIDRLKVQDKGGGNLGAVMRHRQWRPRHVKHSEAGDDGVIGH